MYLLTFANIFVPSHEIDLRAGSPTDSGGLSVIGNAGVSNKEWSAVIWLRMTSPTATHHKIN